jgi:hypothetical protein
MKHTFSSFWSWYERTYTLNISIALFLFALQILHLIWLSLDVVIPRLLEIDSLFPLNSFLEWFIIVVDYTEIPSLISVSLIYINELRSKRGSAKDWLYLFFLNIQLVHIFWITDELVVESFSSPLQFNPLFAWVAIGIDYLEIPVMIDTLKRFLFAIHGKRLSVYLRDEFRKKD